MGEMCRRGENARAEVRKRKPKENDSIWGVRRGPQDLTREAHRAESNPETPKSRSPVREEGCSPRSPQDPNPSTQNGEARVHRRR